ncbi:MAG: hypothetical protein JWM40_403 [Frankiales bacterium]|nr:hypothetical protein [Frankiales bacterium]
MGRQSTSGLRHRLRTKRSTAHAWRVIVFFSGLLLILLGLVLVVLPGPLTIPPILLGLWIWSTEFEAAERLVDRFQDKAKVGWEDVKRHPVRAGLVTGAGLIGLAAFLVRGGPRWVTDRVSDVLG